MGLFKNFKNLLDEATGERHDLDKNLEFDNVFTIKYLTDPEGEYRFDIFDDGKIVYRLRNWKNGKACFEDENGNAIYTFKYEVLDLDLSQPIVRRGLNMDDKYLFYSNNKFSNEYFIKENDNTVRHLLVGGQKDTLLGKLLNTLPYNVYDENENPLATANKERRSQAEGKEMIAYQDFSVKDKKDILSIALLVFMASVQHPDRIKL